jgi:hypothetical protein
MTAEGTQASAHNDFGHANFERSPKLQKHLRLQHRLVGIGSASTHPTLAGKADARAYETRFIQTYERLYGKRPPGNPLDR